MIELTDAALRHTLPGANACTRSPLPNDSSVVVGSANCNLQPERVAQEADHRLGQVGCDAQPSQAIQLHVASIFDPRGAAGTRATPSTRAGPLPTAVTGHARMWGQAEPDSIARADVPLRAACRRWNPAELTSAPARLRRPGTAPGVPAVRRPGSAAPYTGAHPGACPPPTARRRRNARGTRSPNRAP